MKTRRKSKGQSLIEFALIFPLLFLLLMGLFDIGRAVFFYAVMNSAVREGTRHAVVQPYCDYKSNPTACTGSDLDSYPLDCLNASSKANISICNEINNKLFNIGELSTRAITITHLISSNDDPLISIDIDFVFQPITPGLGLISNFIMRVNSQMMMTPVAKP